MSYKTAVSAIARNGAHDIYLGNAIQEQRIGLSHKTCSKLSTGGNSAIHSKILNYRRLTCTIEQTCLVFCTFLIERDSVTLSIQDSAKQFCTTQRLPAVGNVGGQLSTQVIDFLLHKLAKSHQILL